MTTGLFDNGFPRDMQRLNLDWILEQVKSALTASAAIPETVRREVLSQLDTAGLSAIVESVVSQYDFTSEAVAAIKTWVYENILYTPEMFGAIGNGVVDDTAALRDMFASVSTGRKTFTFRPGAVYVVSGEISVDVLKCIIHGNGAEIVYTGNGILFSLVNSFDVTAVSGNDLYNGIWDAGILGWDNLKISNTTRNGTCLNIESSAVVQSPTNARSLAHLTFNQVEVVGFATGLKVKSFAFNLSWRGGGLRNVINVHVPAGGTEYFERISFADVTFGGDVNSPTATGFLIEGGDGRVQCVNCSLDYLTMFAKVATGGAGIFLTNCHIEGNYVDGVWFDNTVSGGYIGLDDCLIVMNGASLKNSMFNCTWPNKAGIALSNCQLYVPVDSALISAAMVTPLLIKGGGGVSIKNVVYNSATALPYAEAVSLLSPGVAGTVNDGFTVTGTADPYVDGNYKGRDISAGSAISATFAATPGKRFTLGFSAEGSGTAYITMKNAAGIEIYSYQTAINAATRTWICATQDLMLPGAVTVSLVFATAGGACKIMNVTFCMD